MQRIQKQSPHNSNLLLLHNPQNKPQNKESPYTQDWELENLIKNWKDNFFSYNFSQDQCFIRFKKQLKEKTNLQVIYSIRIGEILQEKCFKRKYLEYNLSEHPNKSKHTLKIMNQTLFQHKFISQKQYFDFKENYPCNLEESLGLLLMALTDRGFFKAKEKPLSNQQVKVKVYNSFQELQQIWKLIIIAKDEEFWNYVMEQNIIDKIIVKVFKIYRHLLQKDDSMKDLVGKVKIYVSRIVEALKMKDSLKKEKNKIQMSALFFQQEIKERVKQVGLYLHAQKQFICQQQYQKLVRLLKSLSNKDTIRFDTFGSFRSKFYLIGHSDIDIVMKTGNKAYEQQRKKKIIVLQRIKQALQKRQEQSALESYLRSKVYSFDKLPHPFLKIFYRNNKINKGMIVPSMDIVVDNTQGIQNSRLLSLYASADNKLMIFCLFVKLWAIKIQLIKQVKKIEGLSGYGIILMCLFYLMVTEQIPFLKILVDDQHEKKKILQKQGDIEEIYDIGKEKFNLKQSIVDNFQGFLTFYMRQISQGKQGRFHQQKMMVCLLKTHSGYKLYDSNLIINMYDFIDQSNPGRMPIKFAKLRFDQMFLQTYENVKTRQQSFLRLIKGENKNFN